MSARGFKTELVTSELDLNSSHSSWCGQSFEHSGWYSFFWFSLQQVANICCKCQTKSPVTFIDIRKQIIWGNKHITFENWIKSDLIYVNDSLDSTKTLSSKFILEKLKFKSNWIAELNIVKKYIPKNWINTIKNRNSAKSTEIRLYGKMIILRLHIYQIKCYIIHYFLIK